MMVGNGVIISRDAEEVERIRKDWRKSYVMHWKPEGETAGVWTLHLSKECTKECPRDR